MKLRLVALPTLVALGLGLLLYPVAVSWFSARAHAGELGRHTVSVAGLQAEERKALLERASRFNRDLARGVFDDDPDAYAYYRTQLAPRYGGPMGEVTVPDLAVRLPIFHGTDDDTLMRGVGHMFTTSLPIGGATTHSVLTAHAGLVSAELFTNLPRLTYGDIFFVTTLGTTKVYRVDQIKVVEPSDSSWLGLYYGEDFVTLLTCIPVPINSHRLLVRGSRVDPAPPEYQELAAAHRNADAGFPWWAAVFVGGVGGSAVAPKIRLLSPRRTRTAP